jgi:hypothetical protein
MPRKRPTVASFYVVRREEFPHIDPALYFGLLRILDTSCKRAGLYHVVLTDPETAAHPDWPAGVEPRAFDGLPRPLMQCTTEIQARYLESGPAEDVLFVGADCIMLGDPSRRCPAEPALCLSYRHPAANYPINNGFQLIRRHSMERVAALYRRVANRTGERWCDDQRAIRAELEPMPPVCGTFERAGLSIAFVPMRKFNHLPKNMDDPATGAMMLHFRGKQHATGQHRKDFMMSWARRHGFA